MAEKKSGLSRRESQIIEVVYRLGEATISEIAEEIPESIGTSSISKFLWLLEEKGLVTHKRSGRKNVYAAAVSAAEASEGTFENLINTFFQGSASMTVSALINQSRDKLSREEIDDLLDLIGKIRAEET